MDRLHICHDGHETTITELLSQVIWIQAGLTQRCPLLNLKVNTLGLEPCSFRCQREIPGLLSLILVSFLAISNFAFILSESRHYWVIHTHLQSPFFFFQAGLTKWCPLLYLEMDTFRLERCRCWCKNGIFIYNCLVLFLHKLLVLYDKTQVIKRICRLALKHFKECLLSSGNNTLAVAAGVKEDNYGPHHKICCLLFSCIFIGWNVQNLMIEAMRHIGKRMGK